MANRQLAAIMFTDIVGYTALMGKDSDKAMELVQVSMGIQKPLVKKHHGKWLKEMGDGAMAQFNSALDAVNCSIEIQEQAGVKLESKLRIGIHSGDITITDNDIYGDGVNVAARLESITDPGGIYISESIEKAIRGQTNIQCKFLGEIQLKNVDYGVRTYALQGAGLPVPEVKEDKQLSGHLWAEVQRRGVIQAGIYQLIMMYYYSKKQVLYLLFVGGMMLSSGLFLNRCTDSGQQKLDVKPKSSIVFIGNTFIDRLQLFGHFETFLHCQFPSHQLKIRNMGWPADEVALRPRPAGFGKMHLYLENEKADIIFACYGLNESFKGADSLMLFSKNLRIWLEDLKAHQYNGKSAPEIVLISPMAYERLEKLPFGEKRNKELRLYMEAMKEVATDLNLRFIDLFSPTLKYINSDEETKLTFNGIHLTAYGDWRVSHMIAESLFTIDAMPTPTKEEDVNTDLLDLKRTVYDKNYTFLQHWRGPNLEYVHGSRNDTGGATGLDKERGQLINLVQQLDEKIWTFPKPYAGAIWHAVPSNKSLWASTPTYDDINIPEHLKETSVEPLEGDEIAGQILDIEKALEAFHLPKGYEINLFASEQDFPLANPMAMNFDKKGRLWVANTPTWPHPKPGVQPEDFIVILDDTDKDGQADKHTVFMDKLNMIHGFALGFGGVFISQTPNIIFAKDTNGDDIADTYETIMQGFGAEDAEHSINNLTWGPDGGLYFLNGIFSHSQIETPYGPVRIKDSGVFRYEPKLQKLDPYLSDFFWNPWGLAFDETGQGLLLDASSGDFYHMAPMASNFKYPKRKYSCCSANDGPEDHPMHELLSFAPDGVGPAAGIGLIQNSHFPKEARGRFISNQIEGWRGTHWFDLKEKGTSFEVSRLNPELIFSEDKHFRPVAITFGPNGAMYVLDFYSPVFENVEFPKRTKGRDHGHGRIWRITYPSRSLLDHPDFETAYTIDLLDLFKTKDSPLRYFARRELQERSTTEVIGVLENWIEDQDKDHKQYDQLMLEALFIYEGHHIINEKLINQLLASESDGIRAGATRILRYWQGGMDDSELLLQKMVNDENMRVRLEAVIACGHSSSPSAYGIAAQAANHPMDEGIEHALDQTLSFLKELSPLKDKPLKISTTEELQKMPMSPSVCRELLIRNDLKITKADRSKALTYLVRLNSSSHVSEIVRVLQELDITMETKTVDIENHALNDLKDLLLSINQMDLAESRKELETLIDSGKSSAVKGTALLALVIVDENVSAAWKLAQSSETDMAALMADIDLLSDDEIKKSFYDKVMGQLKNPSPGIRETAIRALVHIPFHYEKTQETLETISSNALEPISIRFAALDGLSKLQCKKDGVVITKVEIEVIPSKMEFDLKEFSIPAGAPVEIIFSNTGFQLHNMLICMPGQLEFVAKAAEAMSAQSDALDKHYVPDVKEVLFSTPMIAAKKTYKLQFFAPKNSGTYPYVCTFPGHWRMMNGRMEVVNP